MVAGAICGERVAIMALRKTKLIYVCGLGATGSLGMKQFFAPERKSPEQLKPKDVSTVTFRRLGVFSINDHLRDVACGHGFTLIAAKVQDSSHTVIGCGLNTHSQLGYHASRPGHPLEIIALPSAVFAPTSSPIRRVACGRSHSLLLNEKGHVFSMGNNSLGQCGRPIDENEIYFGNKTVHQLEDLPENIEQIVCGQDHSMFVSSDGKLFSCGWGADGQTGLGHYECQSKVSQVNGDLSGQKIVKVSSFADTVLALDSEGNVYGWGNSEYAQFKVLANSNAEQFNSPRHLNLSFVPGKIVDIAAGGTICALLNDKGQVYVWGFGILGKGPNVSQSSTPTMIPESLFGMNVYNPDTKVDQIYTSLSHFAAVSNKGDLYMWGKNRSGCLGFQHAKDQYFPLQVNMNQATVKKVALGVDHSCALVEKVC